MMRKKYSAPEAEKVTFDYSEHVIASNGCWSTIELLKENGKCISGPGYEEVVWYDNMG